jgi:SAM-dependent methyltransferase
MPAPSPDFAAIRARQQRTWATGDFAVIGNAQQIVGETLCEAIDIEPGSTVLDVACGAGNAAIAAARRACTSTGVDFVPALLERGRERARAERMEVTFVEGDAEALPFADASFDVVLSTFGVMFAADQATAAAELLRTCRPGGIIGLANWTPDSLVGQMFALTARYLPPPPGVASPARWGTADGLGDLLGAGVTGLVATRRDFVFRYRSPEEWVATWRTWFGPVTRIYATVDDARQAAFTEDLLALLATANRSTSGTLVAPSAYLEVIARRI